MKLFDSELKVMDVLWTNGDMPARQIAAILTESIRWNVNTNPRKRLQCAGGVFRRFAWAKPIQPAERMPGVL